MRAVALAIDAIVIGVFASLFGLAVYFYVAERGQPELAQYLYDVTGTAIIVAYGSMEVWRGRTLGKMLFGLVIALPNGAAADRWRLTLRWSTKWFPHLVSLIAAVTLHPTLLEQLAGFMCLVIGVGCLQALDEDKRAWHDEWSKTAVFRRPHRAISSGRDRPLDSTII